MIGPSTAQMKAWARRQMRTCSCGRRYIRPQTNAAYRSGYYKSDFRNPNVCWRCERAVLPQTEGDK